MEEGTKVRDHVLKMMDYLNEVEIHGVQINDKSKINMVIESLPDTFKEFKVSYILNNKDMTLIELMHELHAIEEFYHSRKLPEKGFSSRLKSKDKNEQARVGIGKLSIKRSGKPKGKCYKCGQKGHWKKDCPKIIKIRYLKGIRESLNYSPQDRNLSTPVIEQEEQQQPADQHRIILEQPSLLEPRRSGRVTRLPARYMFLGETYKAISDEHELVEAPNGVKPIGCKWIYKRKRGVDGRVETFKARLVAEGFTQKEGINYEETFSPVAMLKSIRILLSIAAVLDYEIWQMDVKTAFLNRHLEENIYIQQPDGFIQKRPRTHGIHGITFSKDQSPKTSEEIERMRRVPYAEAVGSLMNAMLCTRPDICFAVGMDFRKSTSGYVFTLGSGATSWMSVKQSCITDSTTKAEYVATSEAAKEAIWLCKFLRNLEVVPVVTAPLKLFCDNGGAEPKSLQRKKQTQIYKMIPQEFVRKFGHELSAVATLAVPNGCVWRVGLTKDEGSIWFQNGWHAFVEYHSISAGYFVVFRYRKNSSFQVFILDNLTYCGIQYPSKNSCTPSCQKQPAI
ncbi:hypothetical protein WN944_029502 [Citrus x changshan-huyou]|uniref:CCHC-type domain-containing protein n=1 Tax=Citrus x changshan-huyou TaxID=2935761 RepID=A0AAP0LM59_9ROSI